jgi:hypothetical protein
MQIIPSIRSSENFIIVERYACQVFDTLLCNTAFIVFLKLQNEINDTFPFIWRRGTNIEFFCSLY